jgi:hypothetical protein
MTADEQMTALKRLMGFLTTPPPWRRSEGNEDSVHKPLLPSEMGEWDSHEPMPSCLGMLIIACAYALLTEDAFLVGSVNRVSAELAAPAVFRLFNEAYRLAESRLPLGFQIDSLATKLKNGIGFTSESVWLMNNQRLFHGALLIHLASGEWACVDPYQGNLSLYKPIDRPIGRVNSQLIIQPDAAAAVLGQTKWPDQEAAEQELQQIAQLLDLVARGAVIHPSTPLQDLPARMRDLWQRIGLEGLSDDEAMQRAVAPPPAWPDLPPAAARATIATAEHGSQREIVRQRLLLGFLHAWTDQTWGRAQRARTSQPHCAMTLSSPKRTLAAWTIINLRLRKPERLIAADLMSLSGTDVVFYNARLDQQRGVTTPSEDAIIRQRLARYRQAPRHLLHPLTLQVL